MASNSPFEKLSPKKLKELGLSAKSEQYRNKQTGQIISKRQYQKTIPTREKLGGISNEKISKLFKEGKIKYQSDTYKKAAKAKHQKSIEAKIKRSSSRALHSIHYNDYINNLRLNNKRINLDTLETGHEEHQRSYSKLTDKDSKALASRQWGKLDKETGKYAIEKQLEKTYPDLGAFFYH